MAFVCSLAPDRFTADVMKRGDEYAIHVHVGRDEDVGVSYSLVVGLSPAPPGDYEFFFVLIEVNGHDDTEVELWDSRKIAEIIRKEDRQKILGVILSATRGLVEHAKPERIIVCTHGGPLPEKALEKYHRINHVFMTCGYSVMKCDPYHGRHIWRAERLEK